MHLERETFKEHLFLFYVILLCRSWLTIIMLRRPTYNLVTTPSKVYSEGSCRVQLVICHIVATLCLFLVLAFFVTLKDSWCIKKISFNSYEIATFHRYLVKQLLYYFAWIWIISCWLQLTCFKIIVLCLHKSNSVENI